MKVAVYSTKSYDRKYLELINAKYGLVLEFFDFMLSERTAKMAEHCDAVCIFVNDDGSRKVLEKLAALGVKIIALRCAGLLTGSCRGTYGWVNADVKSPYSPCLSTHS